MAKSPRPVGVRGVIAPPNRADTAGNGATNGYLPLAGTKGPALPRDLDGHRPEGSFPRMKLPSPVHLPDQRFQVKESKMPQPPSAVALGRGAIPVNPWDAQGQPNRAEPEQDIPRPPRK